MRFAVFTVSLPEWTPEEAVRNLAELGYDGVEWRIADDSPQATPGFWQGNRCTFPLRSFVEDAPRIRALTEAAGLTIPAIASYVQAVDVETVERVFRGAASLGTPLARIQVPRYDRQTGYVELWEQARRDYQEVARLARPWGEGTGGDPPRNDRAERQRDAAVPRWVRSRVSRRDLRSR